MGFPTKHDHFEVFFAGYHLFKEVHPYPGYPELPGDCRSPRLSTPSSRMHTMPPGGEEKTLEGFPVMEPQGQPFINGCFNWMMNQIFI